MEVYEAIATRKSIRKFTSEKVSDHDLIVLIKTGEKVPSAGGIHPLKIFSVQNPTLMHDLYFASLQQKVIIQVPSLIIISASFTSTVAKYGERGKRYVYMEAGHAAQNICLMAVSLGLGSVVIGAFKDSRVKLILRIEEDPLYIIPIGHIDEMA